MGNLVYDERKFILVAAQLVGYVVEFHIHVVGVVACARILLDANARLAHDLKLRDSQLGSGNLGHIHAVCDVEGNGLFAHYERGLHVQVGGNRKQAGLLAYINVEDVVLLVEVLANEPGTIGEGANLTRLGEPELTCVTSVTVDGSGRVDNSKHLGICHV